MRIKVELLLFLTIGVVLWDYLIQIIDRLFINSIVQTLIC